MPSKIKPIPVRIPDELRTVIKARAQQTGKSEHSLILAALDKEFSALKAGALVPLAGTFEQKPLQKPAAKPGRARWK